MKPFCGTNVVISRRYVIYERTSPYTLKMSEAQSSMVVEAVTHYKKKLLRHVNDEKADVVLHCLAKLDRVPMTIEILQETGVGRVVNQLKKSIEPESQVAEEAKNIVKKWKEIVSNQEEEEERINAEQHQAPDSKDEGNTEEEDPNRSSGPEDLEEEKSVPQHDSGSDRGPPTLEPQINSPSNKIASKSSQYLSPKGRSREKDITRPDRSEGNNQKDKGREHASKHKTNRQEGNISGIEKEKKRTSDEKAKEHRSKHKSSRSRHEAKLSDNSAKVKEVKKLNTTEKNGGAKHSSSYREKTHRSSDSNSLSSKPNHKQKEKDDKQGLVKPSRSSHGNVSFENKGMFTTAMLDADEAHKSKKSSKSKSGNDLNSSGYSNKSFEDMASRSDHSNFKTNHSINGDRLNGNSLVNVNVPKDINPNYRPTNSWNGATSSLIHPAKMTNDYEGCLGKKKTGMTKVYSGGGRRFVPFKIQIF